jgi:HSP20 family protein
MRFQAAGLPSPAAILLLHSDLQKVTASTMSSAHFLHDEETENQTSMNRLAYYNPRAHARFRPSQPSAAPVTTFRESIEEKDEAYVLQIDLPALRKEELKIEFKDRILTLTATPSDERPFAASGTRAWKIAADLDETAISAKLENGVLELVLPKRKPASPEPLNITIQ